MTALKHTLLYNWHAGRVLKIVFGLILGYQAIRASDFFAGLLGSFFLYQGLTNTGCCGSGGCPVPIQKKGQAPAAADAEDKELNTNDKLRL